MIPFLAHRKKTASFSIVGLMLAIAPLLLVVAASHHVCARSDHIFTRGLDPVPPRQHATMESVRDGPRRQQCWRP